MGVFDQLLQADAFALLDPDTGMGEAIVYTPAPGAGGQAKPINAIVNRMGAAVVNGARVITAPEIDITIALSDVPTININGDTATLPMRMGDTPTTLKVTGIISQDAGCWHLLLAGAKR